MAGKVYSVAPSAARTVTGNAEISADMSDETMLRMVCRVTAVSGTTPSMSVFLQDSLDGGTTWANIPGASAGPITSSASSPISSAYVGAFGPKVRILWTITGTSPSFTFSVDVFAK
jgi:hypothetical protein